MDIDHYSECGNEVDEMMTVINNDNNLTIALNQKNTQDNAYKVNYLKTYFTDQSH